MRHCAEWSFGTRKDVCLRALILARYARSGLACAAPRAPQICRWRDRPLGLRLGPVGLFPLRIGLALMPHQRANLGSARQAAQRPETRRPRPVRTAPLRGARHVASLPLDRTRIPNRCWRSREHRDSRLRCRAVVRLVMTHSAAATSPHRPLQTRVDAEHVFVISANR